MYKFLSKQHLKKLPRLQYQNCDPGLINTLQISSYSDFYLANYYLNAQ